MPQQISSYCIAKFASLNTLIEYTIYICLWFEMNVMQYISF